ncbi:MAG: tRNA uridine-5-carboxymethylaminomethyl(34) synthesis GTPase MnmE [Gammaproteobacteria bacterium]|nr:tRNA uridine-5-carboxymethylaminomethyl(34) synthesis GTPase MnmE [Gammaproteobacteria bacterium]MDE0225836.1 tRNA uridine-5-carboxymethylaminomethyl(34) synthesis GTPase MnmE [Gammaproteobacteria bacterium]MDE0450982.1 tRNA uridine-5-carboxymethylaminomethyl(34) synthesis GTPase MnmE [Gammaproteobacteria bacterium]
MSTVDTDTIAAVATAPGRGGVGIVRVSGPLTPKIANALTGRKLPPRSAVYCGFRDGEGAALDRGIAIHFEAPNSLTGEDVLELQAHGGPVVLDMLLGRVLSLGARRADPGEFTQRAFVNGKLDLAQAEAVLDLVNSATRQAARGAVRSLSGEFSKHVHAIAHEVLELRVFCEGAIDFPDEDIDFLSESDVGERLASARKRLSKLRARARQGALLKDGLNVVIAGAPNVGKSSLLNRLSGEDRAIVTSVPGTTRDTLDADFDLDGMPVRVVDTAGLRDTGDAVETEGINRAHRAMAAADVVLWVVDDREAGGSPGGDACTGAATIIVRNKADLSGRRPGSISPGAVRICALTGEGVDALATEIKQAAGYRAGEGIFTARARHLDALAAADTALAAAAERLVANYGELVAEDLRDAHDHLGAIVGRVSADDLLGEIFASFCIGK